MEPLTLTLLGYPLSVLASITHDQLIKISKKINVDPLKALFLESFFKSLDYHDKVYDDYSAKVVSKLRKAIKKNKNKLLVIFSKHSDDFNKFLSLMKAREFQKKVAQEIIREYSLDLANFPNLMVGIISDCLSFYLRAFFNQMNEKEGIQAILVECLKLDTVLDILKKIDSQIVTKDDFDELRRIILLNYYNKNIEAQKKLDDYDQYLTNKFKYLELRGFSPKISGKEVQMELLDVFVPLEINIDKKIMPSILKEKPPILTRPFELDVPDIEEVEKKDPITSILENRSLVILGDPGAGKSTLMKYLASKVTTLRNSKDIFANIIPLYIRISDYADYFKKEKKTLYDFITERYDKQYQHIFKENFEYSNLLLLLDGLDEITDTPLRIRVTEQVMDIIARYPYNRYIVTSRVVGYQESKLGGDFKHYKLMPFGLGEVELFTERWYKCIAQHTDKDFTRAADQAKSLYSSISRSPSVIRLATNPLLMTIIAMIHYKGKKLPNKRVELYDISTETFLEYWVQLRMDDESQLKDKNEIIEILAPLSFEIHRDKSNALIEEKEFIKSFISNFKNIHTTISDKIAQRECREFIGFLRQQAGFFYEKGVDDEGNRFYGFIHLTFEEYLAAIELVSKWNEGVLELKDYIFDPRWIEIIRLAASQLRLSHKGRAGRIESTKFVRDILSVKDSFSEAYRPLQLVCLILSDDVSIMDELLHEILDQIIDLMSITEFPDITESFSRMFKEILYCDYRSNFIDRFKKEVITDNETLLGNILYMFISNSWDKEIEKILISLSTKNQKIIKAICTLEWQGHKFQSSKVYKQQCSKCLSYLNSKNDEVSFETVTYNFLSALKADKFWHQGSEHIPALLKTIGTLTQISDSKLADTVLIYLLNMTFRVFIRGDPDIYTQLSKYSDNISINKFIRLLDHQNVKNLNDLDYNASARFSLEQFEALLFLNSQSELLKVFFWSTDFNACFLYTFYLADDISKFLQSLESKFSKFERDLIERQIYFILGPRDSADADNTSKFIEAYKNGLLYDFFSWDGFPLVNIKSNPSLFSKIIVQYGQKYSNIQDYRIEKIRELINLRDFNKKSIASPAKLLAYAIRNKPYKKALIEDSIKYFKSCSAIERNGAFSILYKILNPFKLA